MKPHKFLLYTLILLVIAYSQAGCKKFLDAKPDKALAIPGSIKELQGLMNRETNNNAFPVGGLFSDDVVYSPYANWNAIFAPEDKLAYVWDATNDFTKDYTPAYSRVFYANVVLDEIDQINDPVSTIEEYNMVKGSAYFYRSYNFYELAQVFAVPYSPANASSEFGLPLKLSSAIEEPITRATVQRTYEQIVSDAKSSLTYLPPVPGSIASYKTRPCKAAAYGLLARTYLVMGDFATAKLYADSCLSLSGFLLDYNTAPVSITATNPFPRFNDEVIFHATSRNATSLTALRIDTNLFKSYHDDDLRKTAFYRINGDGTFIFKGNYNAAGNRTLYSGIAADEIYLIRAECNARMNQASAAMTDLNYLLAKRWRAGFFTPLTAASADEALTIILRERRKELAFRGSLAWTDLRRLNTDPRFAKTVKRVLNNQTYELAPNDPRYTFLIPANVINMSGVAQNPR